MLIYIHIIYVSVYIYIINYVYIYIYLGSIHLKYTWVCLPIGSGLPSVPGRRCSAAKGAPQRRRRDVNDTLKIWRSDGKKKGLGWGNLD